MTTDLPRPVDEVIVDTKWFQLITRKPPGFDFPHYSIRTQDYVHVLALNDTGHFLLVKQFRPAVWKTTLELPSGHVEPGQNPEEAARAELLEETGHHAEQFDLLGVCSADTGRLGNKMWFFYAPNARPQTGGFHREAGVEFLVYPGTLRHLLQEESFCNGLNRAALLSAVVEGKLKI